MLASRQTTKYIKLSIT